jgi:hypothetical protein
VSRTTPIALLLAGVLTFTGCSGTRSSRSATAAASSAIHYVFVKAGAGLRRAKCRATARALGYPVPCLSEVPRQMGSTGLTFIGQGPPGPWRRWAVGSTSVGPEHLVATASPRPLANYAKVVNGPGWYPRARVQPIAWVSIKGWRMRAVYVPPATNDGSAFAHHVVLIWTVGHHTYGFGFHNLHGRRETLLLDEELARHLILVRP